MSYRIKYDMAGESGLRSTQYVMSVPTRNAGKYDIEEFTSKAHAMARAALIKEYARQCSRILPMRYIPTNVRVIES